MAALLTHFRTSVERGVITNVWSASIEGRFAYTMQEHFSLDGWVFNGNASPPRPIRVYLSNSTMNSYHVYDFAKWRVGEPPASRFYFPQTKICEGG